MPDTNSKKSLPQDKGSKNAIILLRELSLNESRRRYPNVPENRRITPNYSDVMGHRRTAGSLDYIKTSGQRGTTDISATVKGRIIKIEVKLVHNRQTLEQVEYQKKNEASGGLYFIAKDFHHYYRWYYVTWGVQP